MTECERIIKEGILPESFFEPETICDFYVDQNRKKLWAIELDLLMEIDRVCRKYHLHYFLFFGSLLGAVRHKGFIPWDDDIDIIMPRSDYEELVKHCQDFHQPYFFQNCFTDKDFFFVHSRLRNSNTAEIQRPFATRDFNHGIFVDILYYDDFPDSKEGEESFNSIVDDIVKISTYMKLDNPYPNLKDYDRIKKFDGENPFDIFSRIQDKSQKYSNKNTGFVASTAAVVYGYGRCHYHKEDFDSCIMTEFEGYKFPIPSGWDRILRKMYGDYSELPPVSERGGWHGSLWYDTDQSYTKIIKSKDFIDWLKKEY